MSNSSEACLDQTSIIPERLRERLDDSLVELIAGSAEQLGGIQIAGMIRKLSSKNDLLPSIVFWEPAFAASSMTG